MKGPVVNVEEYQQWTRTTAIYKSCVYPQLALAEETGEFLGKIAKYVRDVVDNDNIPEDQKMVAYNKLRSDLVKEAGDVLWQLTRCLDDFGLTLEEAMLTNMVKLDARQKADTIRGSGDNR